MVKYPAQIDNSVSLPSAIDNFTPVTGDAVNRLRDAILAIETELGVKPSGVYTSVRNRLDTIENLFNLDIVSLNGDLGGTTQHPLVIGLQGRPIDTVQPNVNKVLTWNGIVWTPSHVATLQGLPVSATPPNSNQVLTWSGTIWQPSHVATLQGRPIDSIEPNNGQVLAWNGTAWQPSNVSANLTVLPTHIVLPIELNFLNGDGYNSFSSPKRVGARTLDLSLIPPSYVDGRIRTMKFKADLEVTNSATDGYVLLKDVTSNVTIYNTLLTTKNLASTELSAVIYSGTTDGYIRDDVVHMYEVQIYVTGGGSNDFVICRNARIEVTYSDPILVTALVPLALPIDINFICGTQSNGFATPASGGGRKIDMSKFPLSLPDNRTRVMKFYVDAEVSAPGVDGYVQLFDTTNNVVITGTTFRFTSTVTTEQNVTLLVGNSNGKIRNDMEARYEIRLWKISGSPADRIICNNARITVTYI
jgi:hypothetical protein